MARRPSKVRGAKSFRRLLRGMPDAMRVEMTDVLTKAGPSVARYVEGRVDATTKRRTGALRAAVKWKVYPRSLRLRVGFLGTRAGRAKLFYARILDLGRRAQVVNVTRLGGKPYKLKVRAIVAKRFVTGSIDPLRSAISAQLRGIWDRGIRRIAGGDE